MRSWVRAFGVLAASTVLALSCTDANNPFAPDRSFQVQLAPRYAETAVSIASEPITEIRLTVKNASTGAVIQEETRVASEVETPDGSAWEVELEVTPPSDGSDVTILVELLSASGETEWSGETGPIAVSSGSSEVVEDVEIFPGPPANLSVEAVEITTAPATLLEGDTSRLAASLTGGEEGAHAVWSTLTDDPVSVDSDGLVTALLPGTAWIQAAAGPAADTVEIEVLARPDSVLVTPATAVLDVIGAQVQLQAAVVDARGDTLSEEAVTWRVADPSVVSDLGNGLFEAVANGQTEATVLAASDTTVRTSVPLTVAVPDLRAAGFAIDGLVGDTLVEGDTLRFAVDVSNDGAGEAGATTLALRALDAAAPGTVVADSAHPQSALGAGAVLEDTLVVTADDLTGWPDSVIFDVQTDPTDQIAETDETNNALRSTVVRIRRSVSLVVVSPAADTLTAVDGTAQFTAEALDGDGTVLPDRSFSWSSSDPVVATVDGTGLATAVGAGTATISATSEGATGSADLVVALPNLVAVGVQVTTALPDTVVEDDSMTVDLTIRNEGASGAGATSYALQVLDPADLTVVDDTIVALSALAAGDSLVASHTFDTDSLSHWPDSVRFRMAVDDGEAVAESDETDNDVTTGLFWLWRAVRSVVVSPATDTTTTLGDTVRFTAEALDGNGNLLVGRTTTWSSSNTAVATVDGTGLATAVDYGTAMIQATVEGVTGSGELVVERPPPPAGFTKEWIGADAVSPNDWGVDANWNPTGIPTATDTVLVSDTIAQQPVLDGSYSVGGLTVEDGGTLDLASFTLTVDGSVSAGQTIVGPGTLVVTGSGVTLSGSVPDLHIAGDVTLGGPVDVAGALTVQQTAGQLVVGGNTLTVADSLLVHQDGLLVMTDPGDTVRVAGAARFDGRSSAGSFTAGQLEVGGGFTQTSGWSAAAFSASDTHRTVLDGTAAQAVSFASTGSGFHDLDVANTAGVSFVSTTRGSGALVLGAGAVVTAGDYRAAGDVITDATSSLTLTRLHVGGGMTVQGEYVVGATRFTGSGGQVVPAGLPYQSVEVWSDAVLGGPVDVAGALTVQQTAGQLVVGGNTLTVADSLLVHQDGLLVMTDPGDTVRVAGGARFDGRSSAGSLTAGQLEVGGGFTQTSGWSAAAFSASDTHRTVLDGTAAQAVSFASTGSGFHHLDVTNAGSGVSVSGTASVFGDLTVADAAILDSGEGTLITGGQVSSGLSSVVTLQTLELVDDTMSIGGSYSVGTTIFAEAPDALSPQILQQGLSYQNVTVHGVAQYPPDISSTPQTIAGNLTVSGAGALFTPGSCVPVTVQGSLTTELGGAIQLDPDASGCVSERITVDGSATFSGGSTDGLLTGGVLTVAGDFAETATDAFVATGSHTTVLSGTGTVTFADSQPSQFRHLTISGTITVPETSRVSGNLSLTGSGSATGAGALRATGNVTTEALTTLGVNLAMVGGTLDVQGTFSVTTMIFSGGTLTARQEIQPDLPYENVIVLGAAQFPGGTDQSISGNLVVQSTGNFRPGACVLVTVGGNLHTQVSGTITMGNPECPDEITVLGNAIFDGGDTSTTLTDGVLRVAGDLTQTGTSSTASFSPSGLHQVVLNGTGAQTISFDNPGTTTSHFNDLEILNETGTITLLSDVHVTGILTEGRVGNPTIAGSGQTLNMNDASIIGLTFDNVLVELITPVTATPLSDVTFSANYSTAATQLYVEGPNGSVSFNTLTFNTEPTGGGFYLHAHDTAFDQQAFTVDVLSPSPATPGGFINTTGTDGGEPAIVNW